MAKNHALHVAQAPAQSPVEPTQSQGANPPASNTTDKKPKVKPSKVLPTVRISFPKQLELLRAYAAASGTDQKPVTVDEAGELAKMVGSTVTLANPFFLDVGLIKKSDIKGGAWKFIPAQEVFDFVRAYEWDKTTAAQKLAPTMQRTWFVEALMPKLSMSPISEDEAISVLADKATAAPEYKGGLKLLLDFIAAAGVVARENNQVRLLKVDGPTLPAPAPNTGSIKPEEMSEEKSEQVTRLATGFAQPKPGALNFHVDVSVDLAEMGTWSPERISMFFQGVAMVLTAKGKLEQDASKN